MSGHSKWSTIKHKKALKDARRGRAFTKLIKDLTIAARIGGSDVNANPRLRTALAAARAASKNRTVSEIRHFFTKCGGSLGSPNSVAWMFTKKGIITVQKGQVEEDRLLELALDAGAEDVSTGDELFEVVTPPEDLDAVREALEKGGIPLASAEVTMVPQNTVTLSGKEAEQTLKLLDSLQEHDDVQSVSANCEIAQEEIERLSAA